MSTATLIHFRTADGRTCCRTDNPEALCPSCRARLRGAAPHAATAPGPVPKAPTVADKLQRIADARYQATTPPALAQSLTEAAREKVRATMTATPRPTATATAPRAATQSNVPAPPSLITLIQNRSRT
jgi:hypothetical protein